MGIVDHTVEFVKQVPDTVKVGASIAPSSLALLGLPVQEWALLLGAIVSLLFIIEKLPNTIKIFKDFWNYVRRKK